MVTEKIAELAGIVDSVQEDGADGLMNLLEDAKSLLKNSGLLKSAQMIYIPCLLYSYRLLLLPYRL